MLLEIYCEKFHQKRIEFNYGLNVVLGTNSGDNSIGKSTFLLIVDFVLGGTTYSSSSDIIQNVGSHDISFAFSGTSENYYFSRNNINNSVVWKCDKDYNKLSQIDIDEYRNWLNKYYHLELPNLSFRDAVGRYIRVYGKENFNEKHPLNYKYNEKDKKAKYALLKLFDYYTTVADVEKQANDSAEKLKAYKKAQTFSYIEQIGKRDYEKNKKEIERLENELSLLVKTLEEGLLDIDAVISEKAISIKSELTKARRIRGSISSRLKPISDSLTYEFSLSQETVDELGTFFPEANIRRITEIENFHKQISGIFKKELQEQKKQLLLQLTDINKLIGEYESELKELIQNPNLSKNILKKHAELLKEIERLKRINATYLKLVQLETTKQADEARLKLIETEQFTIMANAINNKMSELNTIIYEGKANAPLIAFENETYKFFTPNDTGTGRSYKGLVVFDLAIINLTKLPLIVHDSVVLKQISDDALEKILQLYISCNKQVIITLDKQNSYTDRSNDILTHHKILELAPNGRELFGRSWG